MMREILATQSAGMLLYWLVASEANSASRRLAALRCRHFMKKACFEELLETCILYFFNIGFCDVMIGF
jgi:hypothetical protein